MVPTPEFQLAHYSQREWAKGVVKGCSDPERAFHNWMERDMRFADEVRRQTYSLGLRVLVVDGRQSVKENTTLVQNHFELANGCQRIRKRI